MATTRTVRQGGTRERSQIRATENATAAGVAEEGRAAVPAPTRRIVHRISGAPEREYAPKRFEGQRKRDVDVAESDVKEVDDLDGEARPGIEMADRSDGGALVMESDRVIGGGRASRGGGARRAAERPPAARSAKGAQWMGAQQGAQDQVMESPVENLQDAEAVREGLILRPEQRAGGADPTGEPCTCAYEWEVNERTGDITVYNIGGIATGFRGAPRYMTWCLVCGGERDGQFREDNPRKYGGRIPEPLAPPTAEEVAEQVLRMQGGRGEVDETAMVERVTGRVMDQVGEMLGSERFAETLAEKVAAKMKV